MRAAAALVPGMMQPPLQSWPSQPERAKARNQCAAAATLWLPDEPQSPAPPAHSAVATRAKGGLRARRVPVPGLRPPRACLEAHHEPPLGKGGNPYDLAGIVTLCRGCHIERHHPAAGRARRAAWRALVAEMLAERGLPNKGRALSYSTGYEQNEKRVGTK